MSCYTIAPHHLHGHRAPSPPVHHSPSSYGLRHPTPTHHAPPPHPYVPTSEYDLDEEERLAVAHLRYIRQKREAQQAVLEREAALRAREERDNAIRRAVAEKRIAEAAAALKRQRQREIQEAVERERQRVRSVILQQRQRQEDRARQQYQAQVHAAQQQHQARQLQLNQARSAQVAQAKQCAAKVAQHATQQVAKEVKKEYKDEYEVLQNLLGSLFGISLEDNKEAVKADIKPTPLPVPAPVVAAPTPAPAPAPAATESTPFPEDINELLSQYLGLRIEPTTETKPTPAIQSSQSGPNTIPTGLNDFLSRYGLVFEPLDVSEEVKALDTPKVPTSVEVAPTSVADPPEPTLPALASSSTPTPHQQEAGDDHPLTNYFNNMVDLPPFLRDILGHAEVAYNQQRDGRKKEEVVEGKGKGVAEGERKPTVTPSTPISTPAPTQVAEPTPAPVVESTPTPAPIEATPEVDETAKSLSTLSTISSDLTLVRDSFDFPPTLAFAPSSPSEETSNPPALLFNKVNSGYHAQTHKLLQLLLAADAINSNGNKDVRRKRKEIVREVEMEIERLEKKRDEMWEQVKLAREAGEGVHEHEKEDGSSCASSAVDPGEVKEEVEHVEDVKEESSAEPSESNIASTADVSGSAVEEESKVEVKDDKKARVEEDEGYEVL